MFSTLYKFSVKSQAKQFILSPSGPFSHERHFGWHLSMVLYSELFKKYPTGTYGIHINWGKSTSNPICLQLRQFVELYKR